MIRQRRTIYTRYGLALVLFIATGLLGTLGTQTVWAQDYIGSEACSECHLDQFSDWLASGHPLVPVPRSTTCAWMLGESRSRSAAHR